MIISKLIKELEKIKSKSGDIPVKIATYTIDECECMNWNSDEDIEHVDYGCNDSYIRLSL